MNFTPVPRDYVKVVIPFGENTINNIIIWHVNVFPHTLFVLSARVRTAAKRLNTYTCPVCVGVACVGKKTTERAPNLRGNQQSV